MLLKGCKNLWKHNKGQEYLKEKFILTSPKLEKMLGGEEQFKMS
jgi:hypothetical protein